MFNIPNWIVITLLLATAAANDWTSCQPECKCKWVSGKKTADCLKANLRSIPLLNNEIQSLDLSENQLDRLPKEAFKSVGLVNLHKIHLKQCNIKEVDKEAFSGLGILVELDLSGNRIHTLHPDTFVENIRLRILSISKNPIKKIGPYLFINLFYLQSIDMSHCQITDIDDKAFHNVTNLHNLFLHGNQLSHIKLSALIVLTKLRSLVLHENPWNCDCKLRDFRNWVVERSLYSTPTYCSKPENLQNKNWKNIKPVEFACKPNILWPSKPITVNAESRNISLGCKVTGDPMPEVLWIHNSKPLVDNSQGKYSVNRYNMKEDDLNSHDRWFNVTVIHVDFRDRGQFRCIAKSPGGTDERNITLVVDPDEDGFIGTGNTNDSWPLILGLSTGLVALLILTILCCWFCCRQRQSQSKKSSMVNLPSNGDVMHHHITNSNEQEKSLLTVNPVQKPPRRYEAQNTSGNDAIEMSELNRKLLDENSFQGNACVGEEEQSVECLVTHQEQPIEKQPTSEAHPPDLLAFPSRSHNISPASSSTSNGFDNLSRTSLYPAVQAMSPNLHYNFGTLPYSRSHSPFSPSAPVVLPRQGYVTIPRRPRIPSWSSAPTPSLLDDPLSPVKAEPVYDNLGPRTTADGSSALSLNRSFTENPRSRINSSNTPNYFHFDGGKRTCTSPLSSEKESKKDGILKRTCSADGDIGPTRSKVPPKPPPKPKKDGPLFEDEGEDGTEV